MANRLTDTTIWKKQKWFKKLSLEHKLAWKYLTDECNHAGVWKIDLSELLDDLGLDYFDFEEFISCCNCDFDKKTGKGIKRQRIMKINDDFVWVTGFMNFQYGGKTNIIHESNNAVISAVKLLKSLKLYDLGIKMGYFKVETDATPSNPFKALETPSKPFEALKSPLNPFEPHKDKDKEKDKEKKKVYTEEISNTKNITSKFKLHGLGEIEVTVLDNCDDWQLKELKYFITRSQSSFESIAMSNPLMNKNENFKIVIQQFINMIQSTNDYQESSQLQRFFGNWVGKKNGSLGKFIEDSKNVETEGNKKNKNSYI